MIYQASNYPILSPLIRYDKTEIINLAKQIGTYQISILKWEDICSNIATKHPITKWNIDTSQKIDIDINFEKDIKIEKILI